MVDGLWREKIQLLNLRLQKLEFDTKDLILFINMKIPYTILFICSLFSGYVFL